MIDKVKPNLIAVGYDQQGVERTVKQYVEEKKLNVKIVRIGKFGEDELDSSSKIKQRIIEDFRR